MAKISAPKMPSGPKMSAPKVQMDAIPLKRAPILANRGMDVISITTRMRETPSKKVK